MVHYGASVVNSGQTVYAVMKEVRGAKANRNRLACSDPSRKIRSTYNLYGDVYGLISITVCFMIMPENFCLEVMAGVTYQEAYRFAATQACFQVAAHGMQGTCSQTHMALIKPCGRQGKEPPMNLPYT